jgi:uncharacterized protein (TIGR02302 family)
MTRGTARDRLFARRLVLSQAALAWERLWPALWPMLCIGGFFLVAALFDLASLVPAVVHTVILIGFVLAFAGAAFWGLRSLVWPDVLTARRRIEVKSGFAHRPLAALADQPSVPLDDAAASLWEAHRQRMEAAVRRLRIGWPVAGLARRDPWGLRAVLTILLLIGAIDAGGDWRERIARALNPGLEGGSVAMATSFDIWITPPDYTGLPPQFLRADTPGPVRVPTGSTLLAQIHGGSGLPRLSIDDATSDFKAVDKTNFGAQATLTKGQSLAVTQGGTMLGRWPIEIIPDNPPTASFVQPPGATPRAALRLEYRATDDYGVESVKLVIRRADGKQADKPGAKLEIPLPLPGLHLKDARATSYQDLSPHPWAGLPVEVSIVATDALGQTGESAPVGMTLPERNFTNPVAREIIQQRKELVRDPNSREVAAEVLDDLDKQPALFHDDAVAYLAIAVAAQRLRQGEADAAATAVVPLLWDTALRIEDGGMSLVENDLRRLQQELQNALANNAPDEEIDRLMRELSQSLDRYLQSLAQNMQNNPADEQPPPGPSKVITDRDLQRMLDRARELARSGDKEQARQLLSQLQDMLENLRTARPGQMGQRGNGQAEQMMHDLQNLMQRQQQLLDRSFRAQRRQGPGQDQGDQAGQDAQPGSGSQTGDLGDAAQQQEALRHALGDAMRHMSDGLGDIPDPLGRAERAMHDAVGALQRNAPGEAVGPQSEALDQLQQGARDFAKQLQEQLSKEGRGTGDFEATGRLPPDSLDRDPFGRPLSSNGTYDQGDVAIPDDTVLQKSRQILDELRRRAGERSRPTIELDYIDRLLRQF